MYRPHRIGRNTHRAAHMCRSGLTFGRGPELTDPCRLCMPHATAAQRQWSDWRAAASTGLGSAAAPWAVVQRHQLVRQFRHRGRQGCARWFWKGCRKGSNDKKLRGRCLPFPA